MKKNLGGWIQELCSSAVYMYNFPKLAFFFNTFEQIGLLVADGTVILGSFPLSGHVHPHSFSAKATETD